MHDGLGKSLRSIIKQYSPEAAESSTGKNTFKYNCIHNTHNG